MRLPTSFLSRSRGVSVKAQVFAGFAVLLVILGTVGGVAVTALLGLSGQVSAITAMTSSAMAAHDTDTSLRELRRVIREFARSGDESLLPDVSARRSGLTQ